MKWFPRAQIEYEKKRASYEKRKDLYTRWKANEAQSSTARKTQPPKEPKKEPKLHMLADEDKSILELASFFKIIFARSVHEDDLVDAVRYYESYLARIHEVRRLICFEEYD